jgi:uncharacterized cupin superfamily protein
MVQAAAVPHPVRTAPAKLGPEDLAGPLFERSDVQRPSAGVTLLNTLNSSDNHYFAGIYKAEPGDVEIEFFPYDEFSYFVSGDATLTSQDGAVLQLKVGDAAFIPKGWKGRWSSVSGFTKFYGVYTNGEAH